MPENIRLQITEGAGAPQLGQDGGVQVTAESTLQLSVTGATGAKTAKYRIYEYPDGYALPAGWTLEGNAYVVTVANAGPPPAFNAPAAANWGGFLVDVEVDDRRRNGQIAEDLYDNTLGFYVVSPSGIPDVLYQESSQFDQHRKWAGQLKRILRYVDTVSVEGGSTPAMTRVDGGTLTISSGSITIGTASHYLVDTEGGAAFDTLSAISGGTPGQTFILSPASADRAIIISPNSLDLERGRAAVLSDLSDSITFRLRANTTKEEIGRARTLQALPITEAHDITVADVARVDGIEVYASATLTLNPEATTGIPDGAQLPIVPIFGATATITPAGGTTINESTDSLVVTSPICLQHINGDDWITLGGGSGEVEDGSITTAKLAADAVDGSKLADDAVNSEHIAAGAIDSAHLSADALALSAISKFNGGSLTIASGAITVGIEGRYRLSPEASADFDELVTINGGTDGQVILLSPNAPKSIILNDGDGNIQLQGGTDLVLHSASTTSPSSVALQLRGTYWIQIAAAAKLAPDRTITTSGDLEIGDAGRDDGLVGFSATPITLGIPLVSSVPFPAGAKVLATNYGSGMLTITAVSGVTINGVDAGSVDLDQYKSCILWMLGDNTWLAIGGIS